MATIRSWWPVSPPLIPSCWRLGASWAFEDSPAGTKAALAAGCHVHVLLPHGLACAHYPPQVTCLRSLLDVVL
jgi:pseudouridine-5'-monophosphatase